MSLLVEKLVNTLKEEYAVIRCGSYIFVARNLFVIACITRVNHQKFGVRPLNLFGLINPYLLTSKYHIFYKDIEEDIIFSLRKILATKKVSILYN
jgi:hypothetical protein